LVEDRSGRAGPVLPIEPCCMTAGRGPQFSATNARNTWRMNRMRLPVSASAGPRSKSGLCRPAVVNVSAFSMGFRRVISKLRGARGKRRIAIMGALGAGPRQFVRIRRAPAPSDQGCRHVFEKREHPCRGIIALDRLGNGSRQHLANLIAVVRNGIERGHSVPGRSSRCPRPRNFSHFGLRVCRSPDPRPFEKSTRGRLSIGNLVGSRNPSVMALAMIGLAGGREFGRPQKKFRFFFPPASKGDTFGPARTGRFSEGRQFAHARAPQGFRMGWTVRQSPLCASDWRASFKNPAQPVRHG